MTYMNNVYTIYNIYTKSISGKRLIFFLLTSCLSKGQVIHLTKTLINYLIVYLTVFNGEFIKHWTIFYFIILLIETIWLFKISERNKHPSHKTVICDVYKIFTFVFLYWQYYACNILFCKLLYCDLIIVIKYALNLWGQILIRFLIFIVFFIYF